MTIETICDACVNAVMDAGYNESTIFNYKGVVRRFKKFCKERGVTEYSCDIVKQYADEVISKKTGKFSKNHTQGRFVRLIDSYLIQAYLIFLCLNVERFLLIIHNISLSMRIIRNISTLYMIMKIRYIFMSMQCTAFYSS